MLFSIMNIAHWKDVRTKDGLGLKALNQDGKDQMSGSSSVTGFLFDIGQVTGSKVFKDTFLKVCLYLSFGISRRLACTICLSLSIALLW